MASQGTRGAVWILVGMLTAGVGQYFFARTASGRLSGEELSGVLTWNSASGAMGLIFASPAVTLLIVVVNDHRDSERYRSIARVTLLVSVLCGPLSVLLWLPSSAAVIRGWSGAAAVAFLCVSPLFQALAAIQRGVLSSSTLWPRLALHLIIDGVVRSTVLTIFLSGVLQPTIWIFSAALAPLIAFLVVRGGDNYFLKEVVLEKPRFKDFQDFPALWVSGITQHLLLTLTPNVLALWRAESDVVSEFAVLMFLVRVPVTLSSTVMTPVLSKLAKVEGSERTSLSRVHAWRLMRLTFYVTFCSSVAGFFIGDDLMKVLFPNLRTTGLELTLLVFVAGLTVAAIELHFLAWAREKFWGVSISWLVAGVGFVVLSGFGKQGVQQSLLVYGLSVLFAFLMLARQLRMKF